MKELNKHQTTEYFYFGKVKEIIPEIQHLA